MSACSPKEELEWRSRLADRIYKDDHDPGEQAVFTWLSLKIKPLGTVFGKPGKLELRDCTLWALTRIRYHRKANFNTQSNNGRTNHRSLPSYHKEHKLC